MPCIYFGAICWYQALHVLVYFRSHSRGYHQVLWWVFKRTRESSHRTLEIVDNGITSFNSSWEQDSEESHPVCFILPYLWSSWNKWNSADMRFTRMNNVHIEIEPQALFKDVLQTVLKDSGQLLNKTAPNKFRNRKFPTVYIEAHIELAKVCSISVFNEKRVHSFITYVVRRSHWS